MFLYTVQFICMTIFYFFDSSLSCALSYTYSSRVASVVEVEVVVVSDPFLLNKFLNRSLPLKMVRVADCLGFSATVSSSEEESEFRFRFRLNRDRFRNRRRRFWDVGEDSVVVVVEGDEVVLENQLQRYYRNNSITLTMSCSPLIFF